MTSYKIMRRDHYDSDDDSSVDLAEGIKVVDDLPGTVTVGQIVVKDNKLYIGVSE